ncbi:MAG: DUF120 domain-containing protein [Candidatus Diapherotrites archaeon]
MPKHDNELLLFIAQRAGLHGGATLSTSQIARAISTSQQSASRKLRALELAGMINRAPTARGIEVSLTKKGREHLHAQFQEMKGIFARKTTKKLQGTVISGLGEGSYYLGQKNYLAQLEHALGFKPYPGTLNLKVNEHELKNFTEGIPAVHIAGFSTQGRTFGTSKCWQVVLAGKPKISAAIILPERTSHPGHIIEIISPAKLRSKLALEDGSKITLEAK